MQNVLMIFFTNDFLTGAQDAKKVNLASGKLHQSSQNLSQDVFLSSNYCFLNSFTILCNLYLNNLNLKRQSNERPSVSAVTKTKSFGLKIKIREELKKTNSKGNCSRSKIAITKPNDPIRHVVKAPPPQKKKGGRRLINILILSIYTAEEKFGLLKTLVQGNADD